jgi:ATP-grasp ribosomal peptide maturase
VTCVLVVTCLTDVTADLVIDALRERDAHVVRIDPADLLTGDITFSATLGTGMRGWSGTITTPTRKVKLEEVTAVYYRRPSPWQSDHPDPQTAKFVTSEARHGLGGLLHNLPNAAYVNHSSAIARAEFKPGQLQTALQLGFTVAPTVITNDREAAVLFAREHTPVVYKSLRGLPPDPAGKAGAIWAQRVDPADIDDSIPATTHMFQAEAGKTSDARVTVVGGSVFATEISSADNALDWRRTDWERLHQRPLAVPEATAQRLHAYLDHYGLVFGCFDFAVTGVGDTPSDWTWMECNPNGQWGFLDDHTEIAAAFADVLTSPTGGDRT